jgi:hypothetical protein
MTIRALMVLPLLVTTQFAFSQNVALPKPADQIYKCTVAGRVVYADEPCLGAARVDINPTRGVSTISGKERIGKDEAAARTRDLLADVIKPITGATREEFAVSVRRQSLSEQAKTECRLIDAWAPSAGEPRTEVIRGQ